MSGKRRSAFAVYKQLQKETRQEHVEEERVSISHTIAFCKE